MGDSSQTTKTSQTNTLNPWSQQQYGNLSGQVEKTLNGDYGGSYTPYGQPITAGLTGMQNQAAQMAENNVGAGQGLLGQASQGAGQVKSYAPASVNPQTLASTNLNPYLNPYQQDVINTTMADLDQQRQRDINNQGSQFTANGAFGGSRQGVADALTNEQYGKIAAQTLAGLNSQNFAQAQNAAQGDIANNMTAQQANQNAGLAGAGLNLNASGLLGNLAGEQQALGTNDANEINALGTQQQQSNNAALQAAYEEYLRGQINPAQQAGMQLGLLGETPMLTNSTGSSTTTQSPSPLAMMSALFGGGGGSLFGNMSNALGSTVGALGGLFGGAAPAASAVGAGMGVGGPGFMPIPSDERLKENVVTLGRDQKGRRWVSYTYRNDPTPQVGVIAQEVQKTDPDAVIEHPLLGFLMVDYSKLKAA